MPITCPSCGYVNAEVTSWPKCTRCGATIRQQRQATPHTAPRTPHCPTCCSSRR